jgi:hypothetical protein
LFHYCAHRWFERGLLRSLNASLNLMQDVRCFRTQKKPSHLWRLVENEVYDERLEFRRWYLTFC